MIYYYIKFSNEIPIEISTSFESETSPEILDGWDAVWTSAEWNDYVASIPTPEPVTSETATQVGEFYDMPIDNYATFRAHLTALVTSFGGGDEMVGFDVLTQEEQEFVALNGIGSAEQISSVLAEPTKQTIEYLFSKEVFK